ncbi:MAG: hypothetical protein KGL51_05340 [Betaproteobacteria bacterium]|nr:hypothetical protein [Betaproteobacteria bacterium]MDE2122620.1 hypothetical protein [Betaproteobacteria bacterium]MDE2186568.1 hypothetical protein [Betaproteobacteria bacterium]MDE2324080.1 hypothetical protein [Betaproteobacteria bacterium]
MPENTTTGSDLGKALKLFPEGKASPGPSRVDTDSSSPLTRYAMLTPGVVGTIPELQLAGYQYIK